MQVPCKSFMSFASPMLALCKFYASHVQFLLCHVQLISLQVFFKLYSSCVGALLFIYKLCSIYVQVILKIILGTRFFLSVVYEQPLLECWWIIRLLTKIVIIETTRMPSWNDSGN